MRVHLLRWRRRRGAATALRPLLRTVPFSGWVKSGSVGAVNESRIRLRQGVARVHSLESGQPFLLSLRSLGRLRLPRLHHQQLLLQGRGLTLGLSHS